MKKLILIPAILGATMAFGFNEIERDFANLTDKEKKDLAIAQKWIDEKTTTIPGKNGEVIYLFGKSMPSIVTAPLRLTNISLEPGEEIKDVQIGDSIRWIISLSISGEEPNTTSHIIVKPTEKNLQTTLNIMTNKRVYKLNLISENKKFMPSIAFIYPGEITASLEAYKQKLKEKSQSKNFQKPDEPMPSNIDSLDFGYSIEGKSDFKPLRVYNDGVKTYIQMPKNMKFYEAPALMILDKNDNKEIVNYRLKIDTFIVDRLFNKALLISGVDDKGILIKKMSSKINQEIVNNVLYDLSLKNEEKGE
ncbi:P-type conjugative transfer protein TrbG (plasmid) [Campylobacter vicugnae]|uniref:P-type conjugative transfer protein TrbG n=1 Tax=Campylobacter vicugnae TaxID=1660076 RepID=A0A1X9T433_9BACT|nr:P-type conjugative transfer protein TrbG [Campylobacter sp. RM8964]ARR03159.1 P-type conjugative transfer protein TrbG [Campylobacter sp. RM8964]